MSRYFARIDIRLKDGVLDPQGKAIEHALAALGFSGHGDVRQGKLIELSLDADSDREAKSQAEAMCRQLLANPVIESYSIAISPA